MVALLLQDWVVEEETVKLGRMETLLLEDWSTKVQYKAFCNALRSGINAHLQVSKPLTSGPHSSPGLIVKTNVLTMH